MGKIYALALIFVSILRVRCSDPFLQHSVAFLGDDYVDDFQMVPEQKPDQGMTIYRLPPHTKPLKYELKLTPNLNGNFNFTGEVKIAVRAIFSTKIVYLHSRYLEIKGFKVTKNGRKLDAGIKIDAVNELITVQMDEELVPPDTYEFYFNFTGTLNDDMNGFYRSSYTVNGKTKWLATTQFESTSARMAFPCYDEPNYKANFSISVGRYKNESSLSNMPLLKTSDPDPDNDNRVWDIYETTPAMPTYLVAVIVSQFSFVTNTEHSFAVHARENAIDDGKFALNEGQKLIRHMGAFTSIKYNLPKMDVVAIPDFAAGAMENWGLTTYRERYALFNDKLTSTKSKERVATVIAHELAHQWFGDYVTMSWWDYLWMKEGFATYFEYFITDEVEPSWRMKEFYLIEVVHNSLFYDDVKVHRAMTSVVLSPAQIRSKYDVISYDKAGSVLRMLEHMVSTKTFKQALKIFLTAGYKAGGSVYPGNLWSAFDEQLHQEGKSLPDGLSIAKIMKGWTEQSGYPVIDVLRVSKGDKFNIELTQSTYKSPRSTIEISDKDWIVPVTCTKKHSANFENTEPTMWLHNNKAKIILNSEVRSDEWYLCNIQQTGYYRVNYDNDNWHLLIKQLKEDPNKIHVMNRAQLIDDALSLALDSKLSYYVAFDLVYYLDKEKDVLPWYAALMNLYSLYQRLEATNIEPELKNLLKSRIEIIYNQIGFEVKSDDQHLVKTLRSSMLSIACDLALPDCVSKAKDLYKKNLNDLSKINADLKNVAICTALKTDPKGNAWNNSWNLFRKSNVAHEKESILVVLGCTTDQTLLKKYLFKLIDEKDTDIRRQYETYVYTAVFSTMNGVTAGLKFIEDTLQNISKYNKGETIILHMLSRMQSRIKSDDQLKLLNKLINDASQLDQKKYGSITDSLRDVKNVTIRRREMIEKRLPEISEALKTSSRENSTPTPGTTPRTPGSSASLINPTAIVTLTIVAVNSIFVIIPFKIPAIFL